MALESFGSEAAPLIDKAAMLCHDLLLANKRIKTNAQAVEEVSKTFRAGEEGIWAVYPALVNDLPVVIIELGVG